jgi:hypothetical protein
MVQGDAGTLSPGPPLRREREANPRRAARGDSSKGPLHRPEDPGFGSRPGRGWAHKLLGFSLACSRQITRESNDNKRLRLQTSAPPLIESYGVSEEVTNRDLSASPS